MKHAARVVLAASLLLSTLAASGTSPHWGKIREALSKGLPQSALKSVDPIIARAEARGDWAEAIRAITLKIALEAGIQGNKPEEKITRFQAALRTAPPEMRPVMEAILADWYWQYFRNNRWRFLQRTATATSPGADFTTWDLPRLYAEIDRHFTRALSATALLRRTRVASYDLLLDRGNTPDAYRPTLYDFVAFEALDFYGSGEQAGALPADAFVLRADSSVFAPRERFVGWHLAATDSTSPIVKSLHLYQELLRFHATDRDRTAGIDADLWRIEFARAHAVGAMRDSLYAGALRTIIDRYPDHELSARALHSLASLRQSQDDLVTAHALAKRGADRFPESIGGRRCHNLLAEIEQKSLGIGVSENVWNSPAPTLQVSYRNLDRVHFRLVPFDWETAASRGEVVLPYTLKAIQALLALPPIRRWAAGLPPTPDYRARVERLPLPSRLPAGAYYLLSSARADFAEDANSVGVAIVWVSDLALVLRTGRPGGLEGFVLEARSGAPVSNAEVRSWVRASNRVTPGPTVRSNRDGIFRFPESNELVGLMAIHGDRRLGHWNVAPGYVPPKRSEEEQTIFFTDRAVYRPGQTIQYKGLCIHLNPERDDYATIRRQAVHVIFRDPNGQELAHQDHVTNEHGSFSGSFQAPETGLRGRMVIRTDDIPFGETSIDVEEYKRPKFLVTLDAPRLAPRLGDRAELRGTALAYSGAPIDGAKVEWHVVRDVRYPDWWEWCFGWTATPIWSDQVIAQGSATSDAEGHFPITFAAIPDSSVPPEQEPTFRYSVVSAVTDGAGETHTATRTVNVGYTALQASLSAPQWLETGQPVEISLRTTSLDGVSQSASGRMIVAPLEPPARVSREGDAETSYRSDAAGNFSPISGRAPEASRSLPPDDPRAWPERAPVADRAVLTDSLGHARISLTLPPGDYRARFQGRDRFGKPVTAVLPLRVLDPAATRCPLRARDVFVARGGKLEPGDAFLALWGTGYDHARAYVEVECRGQLLLSYWTDSSRTQVPIRVPVKESMRGGFTVRVTRVAENRAYLTEQGFSVPWSDHELALRWEHFTSKLAPGQRETWTAVVKGPRARRVAAEMVATLYDASLDAFVPMYWSALGGFRANQDWRNPSFPVTPSTLVPVLGRWPWDYRDPSLRYRSLPGGLLWGDYTYGFENLPTLGGSFEIPGPGPQGDKARLAGHVLLRDGRPVGGANVIVLGTKLGAMTDPSGRYVINDLPPGEYTVRVKAIGFDPEVRSTRVRARHTSFLDFRLDAQSVKRFDEIEVHANKKIDTKSSTSKQSITGELLRDLPVDNLASADGLHYRGGRAGEGKFGQDGMPMSDLVGQSVDWAEAAARLDAVAARANLRETAFFRPHLLADRKGEIRIEFTAPEALTQWRFLAFAHDNALRSGVMVAGAVTSKDLMVQPNPPRFLREGDEIEFTVKVTNQSEDPQRGRVRLTFTDGGEGGSADARLENLSPEQPLEVPAHASRTHSWRVHVPDGAGVLRYKAVAATARLSDGEEGWLPVLSRRVLVIESMPLPIRGPATKTFDFVRLRQSAESPTLRHQALTVQVVSNPAWYAVMALPYLMEYPYECSEQTFNRLYANALARHIANSQPRIRAVFDAWRGTPALDSPLEKNEALKSVLISETPWLRQAKAESQARRNVGILFEASRLERENRDVLEKLSRMQSPSGMWPWFPGGEPNEYITLYITTGFGRLRHLGVDVSMDAPLRSLNALDAWMDARYREILRFGDPKANHLSPTVALYLYGRSFFLVDHAIGPAHREALDYWLGQARDHWLKVADRQTRGHLALALVRFGDSTTAKAIMRSVREYSVSDPELGMFWRDTEESWWWYRAPIETQALMIEAFDEVMKDSTAVEDCRVWLLKQKQTQDWKTTKATADAVYALLLRGTDILASKALVEVTLGDSVIRPVTTEAGTGFYERRFSAAQIRPQMARVKLVKTDRGVAWGSLHWQYFEDMEKLTPYAGTPLRLEKTIYLRTAGKTGPKLRALEGAVHVGDELVVRVVLRTDRDMEYVHLKDYRGSGVEPTNVLSGYRYQDGLRYYEETRDVASNFFIDYLPKGTYVFEYPVRVQLRGRYTSGVAEIQCMYAPEFNSHSAAVPLTVE